MWYAHVKKQAGGKSKPADLPFGGDADDYSSPASSDPEVMKLRRELEAAEKKLKESTEKVWMSTPVCLVVSFMLWLIIL